MKKRILTIISPMQARKGYRFIFDGAPAPCLSCGYLSACAENLEVGRIYEVLKVMKKSLECRLHGGKGQVVEVSEAVHDANIRSQAAMPDVVLRFEPLECGLDSCPESGRCRPLGLRPGDRCRVVRVGGAAPCPAGLGLTSVLLERELQPSGTSPQTRQS
ncbi:MAG: UPF0179 family protein [Candidatus Bathyarchaeia archaeon]